MADRERWFSCKTVVVDPSYYGGSVTNDNGEMVPSGSMTASRGPYRGVGAACDDRGPCRREREGWGLIIVSLREKTVRGHTLFYLIVVI